jgi:predicted RNA-binding protein YlxR (DUF448 family)
VTRGGDRLVAPGQGTEMTATKAEKPARRGPRPRHIPQRTCIGCRTTSAKREFVRIVRTLEGRVEVDPTGKKAGRGAYLCRQRSCWETALKRDHVARTLKVTVTAEDREALATFGAALPDAAPEGSAGTA